MKHIRAFAASAILLLGVLCFHALPALARDSGSGTESGSTDTNTSSQSGGDSTSASQATTEAAKKAAEAEAKAEAAQQAAEKAREAAKKISESKKTEAETEIEDKGTDIIKEFKKEGKKEHSQEERAKNCQTRKQGLETKYSNYAANAKKHKANFDEALAKAVNFQTANSLSSADLTALLDKAQAAGSTAESSVEALSGLSPSVDCNNTSVATDVAKFKAAVDQSRNDLDAYRGAVKAYIEELKKLAPATTNNGATQQ